MGVHMKGSKQVASYPLLARRAFGLLRVRGAGWCGAAGVRRAVGARVEVAEAEREEVLYYLLARWVQGSGSGF
jgi:hypothetical protein